jgi:serine/threonine protein kinase
VSPAVDVWGLGAVLYALIYGRPPWVDLNAVAISGPTSFPTISFPPTASPFLYLCRSCLMIEPRMRPSSVAQIADGITITLSHIAAKP